MDASLKAFILQCYDERIALAPMPEEMRASLKDSNRVPEFLRNLHLRLEKLPPRLQRKEVIRDGVYSLTDWFIHAFKKHAEERMMSEAAKMALQENERKKNVIQKAVDTGVIDEEAFDVIQEKAAEEKSS